MENIEKILNEENINSTNLKKLIETRENKKIDFSLIDIRETFESENHRICGTDLFYPTSDFANNRDKYKEINDKRIILYCRTGSRTNQVKHILKSMDINNVSHLENGIVTYDGETERGKI